MACGSIWRGNSPMGCHVIESKRRGWSAKTLRGMIEILDSTFAGHSPLEGSWKSCNALSVINRFMMVQRA